MLKIQNILLSGSNIDDEKKKISQNNDSGGLKKAISDIVEDVKDMTERVDRIQYRYEDQKQRAESLFEAIQLMKERVSLF
jgi:methyl-accepting chemotaxis protein